MHVAYFIDHNMVLRYSNRWSNDMPTVKVSPKFQIVIPKEVREQMGIVAGQQLQVFTYEGRIELIPFEPILRVAGNAKVGLKPWRSLPGKRLEHSFWLIRSPGCRTPGSVSWGRKAPGPSACSGFQCPYPRPPPSPFFLPVPRRRLFQGLRSGVGWFKDGRH